MGDHLSPIMEGFNNPTMDSVFREMLKTTPISPGKPLTYVQGGDVLTYNNLSQIVVLNDNFFPEPPGGVGYMITGANVQPDTKVVNYRFGTSNPSSRYNVIFLDLSKPITAIDSNQIFYYSAQMKRAPIPNVPERVKFLEDLIKQQKDLADSLMQTAKKIGPVIQRKVSTENAYDAAFESDITAPLPNTNGTLQGFTLFFFILSFTCLAIVFSININYVSGNTSYAVYTFISFIFLFIFAIYLINRLG